ncbi:hypothetical protein CLU82_0205 [Flavobacterium sp. 5]|nr:hypothetical protein CLU82_0205 [Flavobacterium sp. 5]
MQSYVKKLEKKSLLYETLNDIDHYLWSELWYFLYTQLITKVMLKKRCININLFLFKNNNCYFLKP